MSAPKGCRALVLACQLFMKPSLSHRGVRTSEGVDVWPLRAMSIAVEASAADVPDNRPLSGASAGWVLPEVTVPLRATLVYPVLDVADAAVGDDYRWLLGYVAV
jgi:hypothetical protein